ncbi:MAG: DUF192 domain-containing protein [Patescibacteria group bacterium]
MQTSQIFFVVLAFSVLGIIYIFYPRKSINIRSVDINGKKVGVEVVTTPTSMAKGLMFRKHLAENSGMLFIFGNSAKHSFWMANTLIPLDIIWIGNDKKIVDIKENAPPCTASVIRSFCTSYIPQEKANYVLEVNGSWCAKNGVKIGDSVLF